MDLSVDFWSKITKNDQQINKVTNDWLNLTKIPPQTDCGDYTGEGICYLKTAQYDIRRPQQFWP